MKREQPAEDDVTKHATEILANESDIEQNSKVSKNKMLTKSYGLKFDNLDLSPINELEEHITAKKSRRKSRRKTVCTKRS